MRIAILATTALAGALCLSGTTLAQSCGPISDEAKVLHGTINANPLIDQGADVHVVTVKSVADYGGRLADVEKTYEKTCPNWRGANGLRKPNLIVIMVAPNDGVKNIFLGSTYDGMFSGSDEINALYSKASNSDFRSGDWTGGLSAVALALNAKVTAWKHPPASEGGRIFLIVFFVLLGLSMCFLVLWWMITNANKRKMELRRAEMMQQKAIRARNDATDAFTNMPKDNFSYASYASKYANLSSSLQSDPTTTGLSADTYEGIANDWIRFSDGIARAIRPSAGTSTPDPAPSDPPPSVPISNRARKRADWHDSHRKAPVYPSPSNVTVVTQAGSGSDLATGMILGSMMSERDDREDYRREDRVERSSRDDSGSSGSDSNWGSSSSNDDSSSGFGSSGDDSSFGSSDSGGSSGDDSGF